MATPQALAPRALYQEVAERLRAQIFSRELEPGHWIDELKICRDLGISRTPLREALKVLAAEGLVTMKVRRGAYVTEMSERDVREAYQLLALLESDATARVCQLASTEQMQELKALHQTLVDQAEHHEAFFATNERFHLRILEIEGNRWRQQIVTDLRRVMKLNRHHSLFKQGRIQDSLQEHEMLIAALVERRSEDAARLMRMHFDNGLAAATHGTPASGAAD